MKKTNLLIIPIVCFLAACSVKQKTEDMSIELNNWQILGPFKSDNQDNYLQFNNLEKWGYTEDQIDFTSFNSIKPDSGITNSAYSKDLKIIDFCEHFGIDPKKSICGNAYAACSFEVRDTSGYYINFTSDDGGKVYLNNQEIIVLEKASLMEKYEIYQPVKLKKGKNFLLVKVNNGLDNWQAFIRIEKFNKVGLKEHNNLVSRLNNSKCFKLSVYDTTHTLIPSASLPDAEMEFKIFSHQDSLVLSGQVNKYMDAYPDISKLPNGLYYIKLSVGESELTQNIFKGDLIEAMKNSITRLKGLNISDKELEGTINANANRFNHLLKQSSRGKNSSEKHDWQRKVIYLYKTLIEIEKNICLNKTVHGIPNIVLRSFVSKIDNHDQYYISHAPRDYNPGIKYPAAIYAPYRVLPELPYLESKRVADIGFMENLQYLSDKYQMIILEPFCREVNQYNFNRIDETDLFEVLNSARKNYNIDTTRIFLTGSCSSADKAIRYAVRYPHLFAGIGLSSPAFATSFSTHEWYLRNLPFDNLENIREMPLLIMHSVNDPHTSIKNSLFFDQLAKEHHLDKYKFVWTENDIEKYFWYKYSEKIFEFFSEIKPKEKIDNIIFKIITVPLKSKKGL